MDLEKSNKATIIEFLKIQFAKRKFVFTPSSILKNLGFPVAFHYFVIQNKSTFSHLKEILKEFEEEGLLMKRESKQDFFGIKEVGYDLCLKKNRI